jgi:hypothetical protein
VNYSFEEAKSIVSESSFLDALFTSSASQQDLTLATSVKVADSQVELDVTSTSQRDPSLDKGTTHFRINTDITQEEMVISASGELEALVDATTIFFNLKQLDITSPDLSVAMLAGMVEGFKNKWFQFSLSGMESLYGDTSFYREQFMQYFDDTSALYREQGSGTYEGMFPPFNGKPAYQFSLDTAKMESLIQELLQLLETTNQTQLAGFGLTGQEDAFSNLTIRIPAFQGNLVILGENDVTEVVDHFEIQMSVSGETAETVDIIGSYRFGKKGMVLTLRNKENNAEVITLSITTSNAPTYDVNISLGELLTLKGTATLAKKADLVIDFDLNVEVIADVETKTTFTVPLKGTRGYKKIDQVQFDVPVDATDLMEVLGNFLGAGEDEASLLDDTDEALVE